MGVGRSYLLLDISNFLRLIYMYTKNDSNLSAPWNIKSDSKASAQNGNNVSQCLGGWIWSLPIVQIFNICWEIIIGTIGYNRDYRWYQTQRRSFGYRGSATVFMKDFLSYHRSFPLQCNILLNNTFRSYNDLI